MVGVAQKLGLPCPFEIQNSSGHGRLKFWATPSKFSKMAYFLEMFKWYYYHFKTFLHASDLEKCLLALASRASDPCINAWDSVECPLKTIIGQVKDAQLLPWVVALVPDSKPGLSIPKLPALTNTPRMHQPYIVLLRANLTCIIKSSLKGQADSAS